MAKDSGSGLGTVLTVAIVGGGAYLLYSWYQASASAAQASSTTAAGGATPPQAPVQTAPVVLVTPPQAAPSTTPPPTTTPRPAGGSLDATYTQLINIATQNAPASGTGPNQLQMLGGLPQATFSGWNYYLNQITGISNLPTYQQLTGNPDPNTAMTGAAYWAIMATWLQQNQGFSGLGIFGGLGALAMQAKRGESRWRW
jgi:hypothetical protein